MGKGLANVNVFRAGASIGCVIKTRVGYKPNFYSKPFKIVLKLPNIELFRSSKELIHSSASNNSEQEM